MTHARWVSSHSISRPPVHRIQPPPFYGCLDSLAYRWSPTGERQQPFGEGLHLLQASGHEVGLAQADHRPPPSYRAVFHHDLIEQGQGSGYSPYNLRGLSLIILCFERALMSVRCRNCAMASTSDDVSVCP